MVPMPEPINTSNHKNINSAPVVKKSMVLSKNEVEKSLTDIYNFYIHAYIQPSK